ncbi:MAG: TRAP transporter substrate-binding protein DctP [Candidatus Aminicenantales bacterium]
MRKIRILIFILISSVAFSFPLHSLVIKIGSIAPARSPWDKAIRQVGREWKEITGGEVELKIYPGGIVGGEGDMIRKMRLGTLGGAVLSNRGLKKIYSDIYVLNIPFLIRTDGELLYVLDKMKPVFEGNIKKKGFKVIIWSMAGWIHFFSKDPIIYPEDLKKHKLSYTVGEPEMEQAWKKSGYHVIPNSMEDLMMSLQSGMVTAFYLTPLIAGSGQYFPLAPHMCSLKVVPLVGAIVLSEKIWDRIPEAFKEKMINSAEKRVEPLYSEVIELENKALKTMVANGLIINKVPDDALEKWKKASEKGMDVLIDKVFSREVYDQVIQYINDYRRMNEK